MQFNSLEAHGRVKRRSRGAWNVDAIAEVTGCAHYRVSGRYDEVMGVARRGVSDRGVIRFRDQATFLAVFLATFGSARLHICHSLPLLTSAHSTCRKSCQYCNMAMMPNFMSGIKTPTFIASV